MSCQLRNLTDRELIWRLEGTEEAQTPIIAELLYRLRRTRSQGGPREIVLIIRGNRDEKSLEFIV